LLTAAILCFVTFLAGGGLSLGPMTATEIALTLGSGALAAGAVLLAPAGARTYGRWSVGLLLAFTALTALSVVWSVQPDESFKDAGRMLAYSGVFGASVALARAAPGRWPAVLGGVTLAAVVVCGYALLTKVFPDQFDAHDIYARLRAPYEYWNAIGLTAAMGVIGCLWLGARRAGHALLSALAYPAMGLLLVTLMLAYSRGALAALALGLALWFCIVPLRLRGAAVLLAGAAGAAGVVVWAFSTHALSADGVALGARTTAGHQLGVVVVAMLAILTLVGSVAGFQSSRRAPSRTTRTNAGALLLTLLALAVLAFAGALAASHRGLGGSISHGVNTLTDTHAAVPLNTPSRLTAIGSVRARYWNEALKIFKAHPALGSGAATYKTARLRYRTETLDVRHAHGFVVQTLSDLGLVGLALVLALLAAWMAAAGRSTHPFNRRWTSGRTLDELRAGAWPAWRGLSEPYSAERVGLLSMICLIVVFGIHSLVDWTWFVPGTACVALLCAGWLAGRGPLAATAPAYASEVMTTTLQHPLTAAGRPRPDGGQAYPLGGVSLPVRISELDRRRVAIAAAAVIAALLAAWAQWQPQRSMDAEQEALAKLRTNPAAADTAARAAVARDPLSANALMTLATVQQTTGRAQVARTTLQHAVHLQPSNPKTWLALGEYDLSGDPRSALNELRAAIYLDPESITGTDAESLTIQGDYVQALRAASPPAAPVTPTSKLPVRPGKPLRRSTKLPRRSTTLPLAAGKLPLRPTKARSGVPLQTLKP
jgi:hypothetical protein